MDEKKGTDPRSLLSSIYEPHEEMTRLVAPLRFIRRCGRCRGCIADGQLILLATEQNSRQGLVTSLVGAGGIATCGLGLLERNKVRRELGYRISAVGSADSHARARSRPCHSQLNRP